MIDIHTHMLPAVDDGAADVGEARLMIEQALAAGTEGIIFTPHMNCSKQRFSCEETKQIFDAFASELEKTGVFLKLWFGGEIKCSFEGIHDTIERLKDGRLPTINGTRYVLIEMDYEVDYDDMLNAVRELIRARFIPVMAHVERYDCLNRDSGRIRELIHQGAYIQINAKILMKGRLSRERRWIEKLLGAERVHFVATDCHDSQVRVPGDLAKARDALIDIVGEEEAYRILEINPQLMLDGEYID